MPTAPTSCSPSLSLPVAPVTTSFSPGGKYTKEDFNAYEKDVEKRSKLALKDHVKPQQEYPAAAWWRSQPMSWSCWTLRLP